MHCDGKPVALSELFKVGYNYKRGPDDDSMHHCGRIVDEYETSLDIGLW